MRPHSISGHCEVHESACNFLSSLQPEELQVDQLLEEQSFLEKQGLAPIVVQDFQFKKLNVESSCFIKQKLLPFLAWLTILASEIQCERIRTDHVCMFLSGRKYNLILILHAKIGIICPSSNLDRICTSFA